MNLKETLEVRLRSSETQHTCSTCSIGGRHDLLTTTPALLSLTLNDLSISYKWKPEMIFKSEFVDSLCMLLCA